jgi:hypothetical protein
MNPARSPGAGPLTWVTLGLLVFNSFLLQYATFGFAVPRFGLLTYQNLLILSLMYGTTPVWGYVAWLGRRLTQVRVAALLVSLLYLGISSLFALLVTLPSVRVLIVEVLGINILDLVISAQFTWGIGCVGGILIVCWILWRTRREPSTEEE